MSYQRFDHAGWLRRHIDREISDTEARVADIIGMVFGGIYNAPINWRSPKASRPYLGAKAVEVVVRDVGLATFDFGQLTRLVFLCHEARIRAEIDSHTRGYFLLRFSARLAEGEISERHPNLDQAVVEFRQYLPADHPIVYRAPPADTSEAAA
ncbi:hypothetical protein [Inquilinus sp. CA228]|uniref:hypothetical protein n=1 Tax=Inquilinus sp. CA228 TaxID=3455609 RepID=UPI003F8D0509